MYTAPPFWSELIQPNTIRRNYMYGIYIYLLEHKMMKRKCFFESKLCTRMKKIWSLILRSR